MRLSIPSLLAVAVAPVAVSAAPFRRNIDNGTATALGTYQFCRLMALVMDSSNLLSPVFAQLLEQLEANFYQQALTKFQPSDFTSAGFTSSSIPIQELTAIGSNEATHVNALGVSISFWTHILLSDRFVAL